VQLIFTSSGKEYLTPKQLRNEIMDEVLAADGRISLVDIAANLGVDITHIERTVPLILKDDRSITLLTGQLITEYVTFTSLSLCQTTCSRDLSDII
jgi:hypothetical protein